MNEFFDLNDLEPKSIDECRFDQIIDFRKSQHRPLLHGDIRKMNKSIRESYENLMDDYMNKIAMADAEVETIENDLHFVNDYEYAYGDTVRERGDTEESLTEALEEAKRHSESVHQQYSDDVNQFFGAVYDTVNYHWADDEGYLTSVLRPDGRTPILMESETKDFLGPDYEKYGQYRFQTFLKEVADRHNVERELPQIDGQDISDGLTFDMKF